MSKEIKNKDSLKNEDKIEQIKEEKNEHVEHLKKKEEIDFKLKYLELLADLENMRKRTEQERSELIKYRAASFIREILPGLDMLEASINAKNVSDEVKNWLIGFKMIMAEFKKALESEGVTEIEAKIGDEFDANYHLAIEQVETDEVEPGQIVKVNLKGYLLNNRLLRPTTVIVAKEKGEKNE